MPWGTYAPEPNLGATPEAAVRMRLVIAYYEGLAGLPGIDHRCRLWHVEHLKDCLKELEYAIGRRTA